MEIIIGMVTKVQRQDSMHTPIYRDGNKSPETRFYAHTYIIAHIYHYINSSVIITNIYSH